MDSEERQKAEEEFRKLRDVLPQYMCVYGADASHLFANDGVLDYFGFTLDDFRAGDFYERAFHPDDLRRVQSVRNQAMSRGEGWEIEARICRKDGVYRWFLIRGKPLRDESGNIVRWFSSGTDIEDLKQAQRELQQLVDTIPHQVVVLDAEGNRLYANRVILDFLGWTLEEFMRSDAPNKAFHPDDLAGFQEARRAFSKGLPFKTEARLRRRDGQYRWFLLLYNPYRDEHGQIVRWYGTGTDIDDRKSVERNLRGKTETLEVFQKLVQSSMEGILAFDSEGRYTVWNSALERIFGINEIERLGKEASDLCPFFHLSGGLNCYRDALTGKGALATDVPYVFTETGRQIYLDAHFSPLLGDEGKIIGGFAIIRDVTDRKRAADALRRSEAYLEEAQQLSHTGSFAHDVAQNEIVYWSAQSYRNFGFDPAHGSIPWQEARNRVHPDDRARLDECVARAIRDKTRGAVDFRVCLQDGAIKHVHSQCRAVLNAANEVVELVGTNADVTEQYTARLALEKALEENKRLKDELYRENLVLKEEIDRSSMFEEIVGTSDALRHVLAHVAKVAPTDSTILISGETGTGKELIARAIHKRSRRSSRPFVSVNCAAIPQALIGSELFGHEKGAFTGATERRFGRFELAHEGTLFLDEVGDLPAETQIALLRVLQERQFERIGGTQPISVDVRVIAATNRDLREAVAAGTFRSDLFYRLNVFPIAVPPLRDRKADISLLVEYLIDRYANKIGKKFKHIQKRTMELFEAYSWPGNIRELQNVIERAVILCDGETFMFDESWLQSDLPKTGYRGDGLGRMGASEEKKLIEKALTQSRGRVSGASGAAARLGVPRSTLETKIRKLGIKKHQFNPD